ncbi:M6 family metalloprotease domain-containing protein [Verrucomicrobiales bacterium]|jgi:M6 family metalloprotease-like protein|nr:M6 family metalloprotease domain-containing protein [Verrucomicrobiales bacterium]
MKQPFVHSSQDFASLILALVAGLLFSGTGQLAAMSAAPGAFTETQPDGSEVHLHLEGDEYFHRLHDTRGYTVLKDRNWFVYARKGDHGRLVPTGLRVGQSDPARAGLSGNILPDAAIRNARRQAMSMPQQAGGVAAAAAESEGVAAAVPATMKNLVILLRFSDHASRAVPPTTDIEVLMNAVGGDPNLAPTGSVRDCFLENSYGQFTLNSTVAYWITLPNTEAYYANNDSGLTSRTHEALRYALNTLDADPNFEFADFDQDSDGRIDAITFLHSGYAAEFGGTSGDGAFYTNRMWSHKWAIGGAWFSSDNVRVYEYHISPAIWGTSGNNIGRIGVIAHETGHFLGLPDLYDGSGGSGIGSWGLMANSWGFDGSQYYPPHLCAWSKINLGWVTPTVISSGGNYTAAQAETSATAYRIDLGYASGEYLLIENRQPVGFDSAMPQGGLCIFHIDEQASYTTEGYPGQTGWPGNGNHYRVALLQADGTYDLERGADRGDSRDAYHAGDVSEIGPNTTPNTDGYQSGNIVVTNNRIFNISASGSSMTFNFEVVGAGQPPAAPTNLGASAASDTRIDLSWSDNSTDETSFRIERSSDGDSFAEIGSTGANVTSYASTGLSANTTYFYRVLASNSSGASDPTNTANATTDPPPPPPVAPSNLAATASSDTAIDLTWADASNNEDGFLVDRSLDSVGWEEGIASLPANSTSFGDSGLNASTTYYYRVRAYNAQGAGTSGVASATTDSPPPYEDAVADSDWFVSGSVAGNYTATHAADSQLQTITERESGGRKSRRYSFLDHRWRFLNVRGGLAVSLHATGDAPANSEGDSFEIEFSTNSGSSWTKFSTRVIIENGSSPGSEFTAFFPGGTQGNIDLRVIDTDSTQGNRNFDSVNIDQLYIRTDIDPNDFAPEAPTAVTASVVSASKVNLSWNDNSTNEIGFFIYRSTDSVNWQEIGNVVANSTAFADTTASPATSYRYQVSAYSPSFETLSVESDEVTTPDGLSLGTLSGGKKRGTIYVDLSWSGGGSLDDVVIWRSTNGGPFQSIVTTANDSSERDNTGLKGGQTFTYEIRSPNGIIVSNSQSISF